MLAKLTKRFMKKYFTSDLPPENQSKYSVYKRKFPEHLIKFTSYHGRQLLKQSLEEGNAQSFPNLIQQFITQQEPSTCGSSSLALILNALHVDPGYNWKGIWRWYDDYNIRGLTDQHIKKGITISQWDSLAKNNNLQSIHFYPLCPKMIKRPQELYVKDQRIQDLIKAATRRSQFFLTANFSRLKLGQTGIGHFSPIAAYNERQKMVLLLDVAKFKYPAYWCPLNLLIESLKDIDKDSNLPRGLILNKKKLQQKIQSVFCDWQSDYKLNDVLYQRVRVGLKENNNKVDCFFKAFDRQNLNMLIPILYDLTSIFDKNSILRLIINELQKEGKFVREYQQYEYEQLYSLVNTFIASKSECKYFFFLLEEAMKQIHLKNRLLLLNSPQNNKFIKKIIMYLQSGKMKQK